MNNYALIGKRLGHSYSQQYFEDLFRRLGLVDHHYSLHEMPSLEGLRDWIAAEDIRGFNVTVPYKQSIISMLDHIDADAESIGAVNCVTVNHGKLTGHNTDAPAFLTSLDHTGWTPSQALILGTGGAAQAVAHALRQRDIPFRFVSRHPEQHPDAIGYNQFSIFNFQFSTLIVNTTPVGMYPDIDSSPLSDSFQSSSLDYSYFSRCSVSLRDAILNFQFLYDLIYNPSPTLLMRQAAALGAKTKDGLEMLHLQAALSWNFFNQSLG